MIETILTPVAVTLRIFSNPLANVFQKQLASDNNHPLFINFLTYLILALVGIFLGISIQWDELSMQFWWYSILGGIAGAMGNGFLVKALQKGDLSVLGPVNSYKSVIGIIVGIFLLGEVPNLWGITGVVLIIWGSYFVLDTTEERFTWALIKRPEIQYRIWAMILTAIEAVFIKKIILASSAMIAFISWCWFGTLFSFLFLFFYKVKVRSEIKNAATRNARKYGYLVLCIGTMQFTTTYTFEHMPVGYGLALFQLSILISVLLGHHVFKEKDIRKKLLGSIIMILGSVVIILLKDL